MKQRWSKLSRTVAKLANAGAWLFAGGTLAALLFITWARWPGANSTSQIMSVTVNGHDYTGLGLRYEGISGTVLVVAEAAVVLAAIVMSILPKTRLRRLGHLMLVGWCGLWLGNAVYVGQHGAGLIWWLLIAVLAALFLCTILRAARGWSGPKLKPKSPSIDPPQGKLALSVT